MTGDSMVYELIAFAGSVILLIGYQLYLRRRIRKDPAYSMHEVSREARHRWVRAIMSTDKDGVLAVQTLRNSVMACSFMASTAALLVVGALNFSTELDKLGQTWRSIHSASPGSSGLHYSITLLLVVDFTCAFFFYSIAIRYYNHVGYMINLPTDLRSKGLTPNYVSNYLERAGRFYYYGLRTFFFSIPLVFWYFGPLPLLAASVLLVAVLYTLDRTPREVRV